MKTRLLSLAFLLAPVAALAQDFDKVEIKVEPVVGGIYMLTGAGGNMALSVGPDGAFLIDDQYAPLSEKILAAVKTVTDTPPPRFVINTHWHGDHTGGNENLGKAGAILVAHENVRRRLAVEQKNALRTTPPSPPGALPVVTFADSLTFHWNGEEIHVFHVESAHTDGDAVIHFKNSDVIHVGDVLFNGLYPFIDVSTGGSVNGTIEAASRILDLAGPRTRIICGHGPACGRTELLIYRNMLVAIRDKVKALIEEGKSLSEIQAAKPTAMFDAAWGKGFIPPDTFVEIVHSSLVAP